MEFLGCFKNDWFAVLGPLWKMVVLLFKSYLNTTQFVIVFDLINTIWFILDLVSKFPIHTPLVPKLSLACGIHKKIIIINVGEVARQWYLPRSYAQASAQRWNNLPRQATLLKSRSPVQQEYIDVYQVIGDIGNICLCISKGHTSLHYTPVRFPLQCS